MHIPPYHKQRSWQRFFVGMLFGGVIAYAILIYMYGVMYEELLEENLQLTEAMNDLEKQNDVLLQDQTDSNAPLTINEIEITIENPEAVKLDSLLVSQLKSLIKQEIGHLIGVEVNIISVSDQLLISAVENKSFKVDDTTYHFTISKLTMAPTLKLTVETKVLNQFEQYVNKSNRYDYINLVVVE